MIYSKIGKRYKELHPFEERLAECERLKTQYPDRIPVILEFDEKLNEYQNKTKDRFLVPGDITMGQFMFVIRSQLRLTHSEAVYLICRGHCIPNTEIFVEIGEKYKENVEMYL